MTDFEIINKKDLKCKYGTGADVIDALSRCRSLFSRVETERNDSNEDEQDYFLVKEFESHLKIVQDSCIHAENQKFTSASEAKDRKASTLSTTPKSIDQPYEESPKNSDNTGLQNVIDCNTSPEKASKTHQHQSSRIMNSSRKPLNKSKWDQSYDELLSYVESVGHARVPLEFLQNPSFGVWVATQRRNYKKFQKGVWSRMTKNRMKLLNKVGFEWDPTAHSSDRSYENLESFNLDSTSASKESVSDVFKLSSRPESDDHPCEQNPKINSDNANLRVVTNHSDSVKNKVETQRLQTCHDVSSSRKSRIENRWDQRYKELLSFVENNGHARVSRRQYTSLGNW
eukprot:CAMPEP_0194398142 /NCGR_PEP_ID=MMETSP0174-20130528/125941_1 /TAXON_ID=216777 /ORGANISM="Proboscia alata, Strain PI-D3" /LENGTH=341 /DNA_ID=CAMNT_0039194409 /DNA_START=46 /DNA_END=1068 /DNA_ORIENTATION=-